jgi:predicted nuclease of predicted toxin-antitoxin system
MDHHVPAAITQGLRQRGVDVITAEEDGSTQLDDELLFERTTLLGRTLFTQDRDFLAISYRWHQAGRNFAGLAYAHQLNISIGQAVQDLELIAKVFDPDDMINRIEFIPYS